MNMKRIDIKMNKIKQMISPLSIALIGVSSNLQKNSGRLFANLIKTKYKGEIYLVNPYYNKILYMDCYPSVLDVQESVDLACVISPPDTVLHIVKECIKKGVKSVVILSDGFSTNVGTKNISEKLKDLIIDEDIVLYGPNTEGLSIYDKNWGLSYFPSYESRKFKSGNVGLISSGTIGKTIVESNQKGIGFSYWFSPGDELDITVEDCLEFLIKDEKTGVILLVIKKVTNEKRFISLIKKANKLNKPIIYLTIGSTITSASKSLNLIEKSIMHEFDQYYPGFIKVDSLNEMVSLAWLFEKGQGLHLPSINVLMYSWSPSVVHYLNSLCEHYGIHLPALSPKLSSRLNVLLEKNATSKNPLDVSSVIYRDLDAVTDSLQKVVDSKEYNVLMLVFPFQLNYHNEVIAQEMIELNESQDVLFIPLFLSQGNHKELALELIKENHIPCFFDEHVALKSLTNILRYNNILNKKDNV